MEARPGVRDIKVIYPETGMPAKTLCVGIVEIEPDTHSLRHIWKMNASPLSPLR
jgi:hypothetical protein